MSQSLTQKFCKIVGGVISPLLANVALHGMEERIKQYADTLDKKGNNGYQRSLRDKRKSLSLRRCIIER